MSRDPHSYRRSGLGLAVIGALVAAGLVGWAVTRPAPPVAEVAGIAATPGAAHLGGLSSATPIDAAPRSTDGAAFDGTPDPNATPLPDVTLHPALQSTCNPAAVPGSTAVTIPDAPAAPISLHVPILMYHRVIPFALAGNSLHGLVAPPDEFAAQMRELKNAGWHTITMGQLAQDLAEGVSPAAKTFVVSFDDGYDDGYLYALPVLQQNGFVGTFFVIPERIDHPEFLTTPHIQALVAAGNEIGDHTMDHVDLPAQTPSRLTFEIQAAAMRIAEVTGRWPASFAYPFGAVDGRVVQAVAACSQLRMAVTTVPGASETWSNRFEEPRVRVGPGTSPAGLLAELDRFR